MTGPFRRPRVEGRLHRRGPARLGHRLGLGGPARIVVENSYVTVTRRLDPASATRRSAPTDSSRSATRGATAAKRSTRASASTRRDLDSLRHAFEIDDYPVSGRLTGEFHLTGEYERPIGFGAMTIERGHGLRRAVREGHGVAAVRRDGRPARRRHARQGGGTITGAAFVGWDCDLFVQRRRPPHSGGPDRRVRLPAAAARPASIEFTAGGSGTFDEPALRRQVPRQRSVRRRGAGRPGHRDARAPRQRAERRDRRGVAAPGDHRHRPDRADAAGRRRADVPLPRQLARSVRPAVRADAVAVHDGRRQRLDPRRRRARRRRSPAGRRHGRQRRDAAVRLRAAERAGRSGSRSISTSSASRSSSWSARTRSCAIGGTIGLHDQRIALQARRRREPRHPAGLLPTTCAARAAPS